MSLQTFKDRLIIKVNKLNLKRMAPIFVKITLKQPENRDQYSKSYLTHEPVYGQGKCLPFESCTQGFQQVLGKFSQQNLQRVYTVQRDSLSTLTKMFLFQCFTGPSYSDLKVLNARNIETDYRGET